MKTKLLTLALVASAAVAGCTASAPPWAQQHQPILGQATAPAALAPEGPSAAGSPLFEAMQEPGAGYAKRAR